MHAALQQETGSAVHGVLHDADGFFGAESQFHAAFHGRADVAHGKGNTAGGKRRAGSEVLLIGDHGVPQSSKQIVNKSRLFVRGILTADEGDTIQHFHGGVRDGAEERGCLWGGKEQLHFLQADTGRDRYNQLAIEVEHRADFLNDFADEPRLDGENDDICLACGQSVVSGGLHAGQGGLNASQTGF